MTDENLEQDDSQERRNRLRTVLAIVLALLVLLLIALTVFAVRLLTPAGGPSDVDVPEGLQWVLSIYGTGPTDADVFRAPNDAAVAPDGTIWVLDAQRGRIPAFRTDGSFTGVMVDTGPPRDHPGTLYGASGIDTDEDGNVYVANYGGNSVLVFDPDGRLVSEWEVPLPRDIDVGADRIAVTSVSGVALLDRQGELIGLIGQRGDGPEDFDNPYGVVQDDDGTLYVADTLNRRVKAYSADGDLLWVFPESHSDSADIPSQATEDEPFQLPLGMVMDSAGRLVLMDAFNLQIVVLDPEKQGAVVGRYGELGSDDGLFAYPTGLAYDAARDWFVVADTENDRAQVFRVDGSGGGLPAAARRLLAGPLRLCAIPLILLLIALVIAVLRRRARKREQDAVKASETGSFVDAGTTTSDGESGGESGGE